MNTENDPLKPKVWVAETVSQEDKWKKSDER